VVEEREGEVEVVLEAREKAEGTCLEELPSRYEPS